MFADEMRFALHSLLRHRLFAFSVLISLGFGYGACILVFSVVSALGAGSTPYPDAGALVELFETASRSCAVCRDNASGTTIARWRSLRMPAFGPIAEVGGGELVLSREPTAPPTVGAFVDETFFSVLGVHPEIGRVLTRYDSSQSTEPGIVLSDALWRRNFDGDPRVIGTLLRTGDGLQFRILGVMPAAFAYPANAQWWAPLGGTATADPGQRAFIGLARLTPGATLASARRQLAAAAHQAEQDDPIGNDDRGANATSFIEERARIMAGSSLWLIALVVAAVFGLVTANVIGMYLTRLLAREHEFAVRTALGARLTRIATQLLTEALAAALVGVGLGICFALLARQRVMEMLDASLHMDVPMAINGRVVLFALVLAVSTAVLISIFPLYRLTKIQLQHTLKAGATTATDDQRSNSLRRAFVMAEIAAAVVLVSAAATFVRSFRYIEQFDPGFDARGVLTTNIDLRQIHTDSLRIRIASDDAARRLRRTAGVKNAAVWGIIGIPMTFGRHRRAPVTPQGRQDVLPFRDYPMIVTVGDPDLFRTLGLLLRSGRTFAASDVSGAAPVAVINQVTADKFWPGENAIGKRLKLGPPDSVGEWRTVVGVVSNSIRIDEPGLLLALVNPGRSWPAIYFPLAQIPLSSLRPPFLTMGVRVTTDNADARGRVRRALLESFPMLALGMPQTLEESMVSHGSLATTRFLARMLTWFAVIGSALALTGISTLTLDTVRRRRREMGIRSAIGASSTALMLLVLKDALSTAIVGLAVGTGLLPVCAWILRDILLGTHPDPRVLTGVLYGVQPLDLIAITGSVVAVLFTTVVACSIPARAALSVAPAEVLRAE